jgi:hypothetical protein
MKMGIFSQNLNIQRHQAGSCDSHLRHFDDVVQFRNRCQDPIRQPPRPQEVPMEIPWKLDGNYGIYRSIYLSIYLYTYVCVMYISPTLL